MARDKRKPHWLFYPGWIMLSAVSVPIAFVIAFAILAQAVKVVGPTIQVGGQTHITEDYLLSYIVVPPIGLLTGVLQYLLLRRYLPHMIWWIVATVLGWLLFSVADGFSPLYSTVAPPTLAGVLLGGLIGLPQWWVLRPRVPRAAVWVLASVLGWGIAFLLTDGAISSLQEVLAVVLLPPIVASFGWWLLLDKLPQRASNASNTPSSASMLLGTH